MLSKGEKLQKVILSLFPPGIAWDNSRIEKISKIIANEFEKIDIRCDQLETEIDPKTSDFLFDRWRSLFLLEDEISNLTLEQQKAIVETRLTDIGENNASIFFEYIKAFDANIKPEENRYRAFRTGSGTMGKPIYDESWEWVLVLKNFPMESGSPNRSIVEKIEERSQSHLIIHYES